MKQKGIIAVVLAAGSGSRFWPLVTNKVLFPFCQTPLFDFSVARALPKDISKLVVIASPQTAPYYKRRSFPVPSQIVVQQEAKGMADALLSAKDVLMGHSLLVCIADDVFDPTLLSHILQTAKGSDAFGVMPGWQVDQYRDLGYLRLDGKRILDVVEKPGPGKTPSDFAYISGQFIRDSQTLFAAIEKTTTDKDDRYEKALASLMKSQEFVMVPYTGRFDSLKMPWHVLDVWDHLSQNLVAHRGRDVVIKNNVSIEGAVWIGNNVKIFENTKIIGPCFIGDNSIVGNNNIIRESHIGAGSVTGFSTDIARSFIGDQCWFHTNYVGDSVLEGNVSMGSGTVLANLRLDEGTITSQIKGKKYDSTRTKLGAIIGKNVRMGVNVSVMPGIKIGTNTAIGAGVVVTQDIPDNSFCTMERTPLRIIPNKHATGSKDRSKFKKAI